MFLRNPSAKELLMYSIGQVSKMFDIPVSTLRYYDKEGLFPPFGALGQHAAFRRG